MYRQNNTERLDEVLGLSIDAWNDGHHRIALKQQPLLRRLAAAQVPAEASLRAIAFSALFGFDYRQELVRDVCERIFSKAADPEVIEFAETEPVGYGIFGTMLEIEAELVELFPSHDAMDRLRSHLRSTENLAVNCSKHQAARVLIKRVDATLACVAGDYSAARRLHKEFIEEDKEFVSSHSHSRSTDEVGTETSSGGEADDEGEVISLVRPCERLITQADYAAASGDLDEAKEHLQDVVDNHMSGCCLASRATALARMACLFPTDWETNRHLTECSNAVRTMGSSFHRQLLHLGRFVHATVQNEEADAQSYLTKLETAEVTTRAPHLRSLVDACRAAVVGNLEEARAACVARAAWFRPVCDSLLV